ncbi:MAG: hypothetical protein ACQESF_06275 [Nanobdellota archaeon]
MLREILGIGKLEKRLEKQGKQLKRLENVMHKFEDRLEKIENPRNPKTVAKDINDILKALKKPMTTTDLAEKLDKHRSWISLLLNRLEREGKVVEARRKGREIVYAKV